MLSIDLEAVVEDSNVNVCKRRRCLADRKSTYHCCLEDDTTEVVRCVIATVLRVLSKGRTGRRTPSRMLCRHCAFDGHLGTKVTCNGDQALTAFPNRRVQPPTSEEENACLAAAVT